MGPKKDSLQAAGVIPIRGVRLVDEATSVIRGAILAGKLRAGMRLGQEELARQMGISRTPLREALMKLEQEGLIEVLPRRGFQVVELKLEEAIELYDLREVLDGLAASLTARSIDRQTLENLESQLTKMAKCIKRQNAHEWFVHHVAFHNEIYRASGNERLIGLISTVRLSIQRFHPLLLTTPNRLKNAYQEHLGTFRAIKARHPQQAERLARLHIANAKGIVLKVMADQKHLGQTVAG